jgi:hypothetical protein
MSRIDEKVLDVFRAGVSAVKIRNENLGGLALLIPHRRISRRVDDSTLESTIILPPHQDTQWKNAAENGIQVQAPSTLLEVLV